MTRRKEQRNEKCPHCRCRTQHFLEWQYRRWETSDSATPADDMTNYRSYYVARCARCGEIILYVNDPPHDDICDNFEGTQPEAETVLLWPGLSVSVDAIPERVKDCYEEALIVRRTSLNAFATSMGRALEAICEERGIVKGPLGKSLQALAFKEELRPRLLEFADLLRSVRNIGSHNDRDVTKAEAVLIDRCFKLLIEYLYELPEEIRRLKESLAARTQKELHMEAYGDDSPDSAGTTKVN